MLVLEVGGTRDEGRSTDDEERCAGLLLQVNMLNPRGVSPCPLLGDDKAVLGEG